jgi:hypothetical protein
MNIPAPDPGWIPFLKIVFGYLVLLTLVILAGVIALGKVEEHTSFGLAGIIGALSVLAGGFAQWAFGSDKTQGTGDKQ